MKWSHHLAAVLFSVFPPLFEQTTGLAYMAFPNPLYKITKRQCKGCPLSLQLGRDGPFSTLWQCGTPEVQVWGIRNWKVSVNNKQKMGVATKQKCPHYWNIVSHEFSQLIGSEYEACWSLSRQFIMVWIWGGCNTETHPFSRRDPISTFTFRLDWSSWFVDACICSLFNCLIGRMAKCSIDKWLCPGSVHITTCDFAVDLIYMEQNSSNYR